MTKSLLLTDPSANELLGNAQQPQATTMSQRLRGEIIDGLGAPAGGGGGGGIPPSIPPFTNVIAREWQWGQPFPLLDTYSNPGGPMGPHGLVVVGFTPQITDGGMHASVAPYPGTYPGKSCDRACSISTKPGDFSQPWPWIRYGYDTGIDACVLPRVLRGAASMTPGVRYYLNLANIDQSGGWTTVSPAELRLEISGPQG